MAGIKLALIYNPKDNKLQESSYSHTYKNQFFALMSRFDSVQHITKPINADEINADVIIFYDVHSCHDIEIKGIENHKAIKYEYFNDPFQPNEKYIPRVGIPVMKLGPKERTERALGRGVNYIICPQKNTYYKYIAPHLKEPDEMLVWFPPSPKDMKAGGKPLNIRSTKVVMNGHTWVGEEGFRPYEFRNWSANQSYVTYVKHCINGDTPKGAEHQKFLARFAGALALCDTHIVPKYFEIPLAGCVCFAQYHKEYEELGFLDGINCIYVNKDNIEKKITEFKTRKIPSSYQLIADAGRRLVAENYTASHFADFIYRHAKERL